MIVIIVQRGTGLREGVINADAETVWALLTDWGTMDWWGNELQEAGMKVSRCFLEGIEGTVPRTKVIERANSDDAGLPHTNRETLIHEDPIARQLFYNGTDNFVEGVRNYIATWAFDPLPDGKTKMHISSVFDVVEPGDVNAVRDIVEAVYEMIFKGINGYFASRNVTAETPA
ncbi:SRPBCC family protein [Sphingobium sp. CR2-8]|uniref:SRPBCC family protein n=1 Tax=Sphingobium sp. CR2-8 TaxID=1306534 RepID=UPI002DBCF91E|nr:SRPBCC family protein [Sphingobium sp. CR2-8]MEC3909096.1 SRPBCC family protein [Sphingobium sp. CR2-8]